MNLTAWIWLLFPLFLPQNHLRFKEQQIPELIKVKSNLHLYRYTI